MFDNLLLQPARKGSDVWGREAENERTRMLKEAHAANQKLAPAMRVGTKALTRPLSPVSGSDLEMGLVQEAVKVTAPDKSEPDLLLPQCRAGPTATWLQIAPPEQETAQ